MRHPCATSYVGRAPATHMRVLEAFVADFELHGEAKLAIHTSLKDEQVRTSGPTSAGGVGTFPEGSASRRAVDEHVVRVAPVNARDSCSRVSGLSCFLPLSERGGFWMPPSPCLRLRSTTNIHRSERSASAYPDGGSGADAATTAKSQR